jgi:fluoroacetyl-CoA thioesterase
MKPSLKPGLTFEFQFPVTMDRTVPALLPDAPEFQLMPGVLASGYMVGLIEWACIQAVNPHLDWPREQTVGIDFQLNHSAATPPGLTVTVKGRLENVEGRKLTFSVLAADEFDQISQGFHHRFVIDAAKFNAKAAAKEAQLNGSRKTAGDAAKKL